MNELFVSLVALVAAAFWTWRSLCQLAYARRVRREQRERTRGLRLVRGYDHVDAAGARSIRHPKPHFTVIVRMPRS